MNLLDTDRDRDVVPGPSGIDRGVGYLAIGLTAVCFFFLAVFGMSRVEWLTKAQTQPAAAATSSARTEIGGAEPSGK